MKCWKYTQNVYVYIYVIYVCISILNYVCIYEYNMYVFYVCMYVMYVIYVMYVMYVCIYLGVSYVYMYAILYVYT